MPRPPLDIDPEIARSHTLPGWAYGDPDLHRRMVERVFARSWQWVGEADRLKAPGHVLPTILLEGTLDEPIVLVRDMPEADGADPEGEFRCLSNVCTHRGALVVEGEGHLRQLRCRYHGRRFGLDGCFLSMPEFEGVEGIDPSVPYVHGHSLGALDYEGYTSERFRWGNLQLGVGKEGEPGFELPDGHPDEGRGVIAYYFWLFPNLMLNSTRGGSR